MKNAQKLLTISALTVLTVGCYEMTSVKDMVKQGGFEEAYSVDKIMVIETSSGNLHGKLNGGFLGGSSGEFDGKHFGGIAILAICRQSQDESTFAMPIPLTLVSWIQNDESPVTILRITFKSDYANTSFPTSASGETTSYEIHERNRIADWRENPALALQEASKVTITLPTSEYEKILDQLENASKVQSSE